MWIERLGSRDEMLGPACREQIELFQKIKELIAGPFRVGKALVPRVRLDHRFGLFAGHALDGAAPQLEIGGADAALQFERALRIRQPVFQHLAERLDRVSDLIRKIDRCGAFLARLQIGGERLATLFDQTRDIKGKAFDIDAACLRHRQSVRHLVHWPRSTFPQLQMAAARACRKVTRRRLWTLTAHSFILAFVILTR
jgi:hypothetical protein